MKNFSIPVIAFLVLLFTSLAQAPDTLWTQTSGGDWNDCAYSVQQTTDGLYIIASSTGGDVCLIKTAPDLSYVNQDIDIIPLDFSLHQNYPKPFNAITKIGCSVPQQLKVVMKAYKVPGNEIETFLREEKSLMS